MGRKKKEPQVTPPINIMSTASNAQKHYIWENWGKKSTDEIARDTKLTVDQVETIATSSELDREPLRDEAAPQKIRRFETYKGTAVMTPQQSMLDDKVYANNLPNIKEVNARIPGIEMIKVNPPLNAQPNSNG